MDLQKKAEKHWNDTYGNDESIGQNSKLWDDENDEANHKDVSCVGYIDGYRKFAQEVKEILLDRTKSNGNGHIDQIKELVDKSRGLRK